MVRNQFTFYASFAAALARIKRKSDRADAYDAICRYALYGDEPDLDRLSDAAAIAFDLIRPNLDASRRKAECGRAGGSARPAAPRQPPTAPPKLPPSKKETEQEKESESEPEAEGESRGAAPPMPVRPGPPPPPPPEGGAEEARRLPDTYRQRTGQTLSPSAQAELLDFARTMGPPCCLRAMDAALDAGKPSWAYVRAILKAKSAQGVRSLADWDRVDAARRRRPAAPPRPGPPSSADPAALRADLDWMDDFLARTAHDPAPGKECL